MIPISDDNPTRRRPYVVYALIAINVVVYLGQISSNYLNSTFTMIPWSVIHNQRVDIIVNQFGQMVDVVPVAGGISPQWVTILTSMFMHGSLMHIGGNMLYLWIFGNNIEDLLGHAWFLVFYLVCGVLAGAAHIASGPNSPIPTLGASGAIAGMLGSYLIVFPHARVNTLVMLGFFWDVIEIPAILVLGVWFLLQLTGTLGTGGQVGGGVAYWAHIGGFIAGAVLILMVNGRELARRRPRYQSPYNEDRPHPWRPWR